MSGRRHAPLRPYWEHFPHDADLGVRGVGGSPAQAFEQAALALSASVASLARVRATECVSLRANAPDLAALLVDWLNAVIFEMATRHMIFARYEIDIDGTQLRAKAWGEAVNPVRHRPACEPKAATYTALSVHERDDGCWEAACVVDV
jgi:SHS2 domain-containing protein